MRRRRVLIADDNARSRSGLRALLSTRAEVEVIGEAVNGQEAVRLMEECRPDVVLMDAQMPVMNGVEATRLIKERWPGCRVVVLTMYPSYRADALAAGADAFVSKADPPERLLAACTTVGTGNADRWAIEPSPKKGVDKDGDQELYECTAVGRVGGGCAGADAGAGPDGLE